MKGLDQFTKARSLPQGGPWETGLAAFLQAAYSPDPAWQTAWLLPPRGYSEITNKKTTVHSLSSQHKPNVQH